MGAIGGQDEHAPRAGGEQVAGGQAAIQRANPLARATGIGRTDQGIGNLGW
jgi:hypothetical protein